MTSRVHIIDDLVILRDVVCLVNQVRAESVGHVASLFEVIFVKLLEKIEVSFTLACNLGYLILIQVFCVITIGHFEVKVGQQSVRSWQKVNNFLRVVLYPFAISTQVHNRFSIDKDLLR